MTGPSRRAVMVGAVSCVAVARRASAQATPALRLGGVRCDAQGVAAVGNGAAADLIARIMPSKLSQVFSDLIVADRASPILVARIDQVFLSFYTGPNPSGTASQVQDWMDGFGLVVGGGAVRSSTPLHVALPATFSGPYYLPDINERRVDSICYQFAYWLRREMQV